MAAITCERFVFEKTSAIDSGAHATEGISILKELGIFIFEGAGELVVKFVQFFEERVVNGLVGGADQAALDGFAAFFGQGGGARSPVRG